MTRESDLTADEPESIINDFIDEDDVIVRHLGSIQPANVVRTAKPRTQRRANHQACQKLGNGVFLYERPHEYVHEYVYRRVHEYSRAREYRSLHTYPPSKPIIRLPVAAKPVEPLQQQTPAAKPTLKSSAVQTMTPAAVSAAPKQTQTSPIPPSPKPPLQSAAIQTQTSPIPPPLAAVPIVVPAVMSRPAVAMTDSSTSPIPPPEPVLKTPETEKKTPITPSPPSPKQTMPPVEEHHPHEEPVRDDRSSVVDRPVIAVVAVAAVAAETRSHHAEAAAPVSNEPRQPAMTAAVLKSIERSMGMYR